MEVVSFEIAKKLKERGYREKAMYFYDELGYDWHCIEPSNMNNTRNYSAPFISQVLKWLRKNHNIFIVVFLNDDTDNPVTYEIYQGTECLLHHHGRYFSLQEWDKANIDAIEYVLDNLI